ncbi:MAG: CHAD domain-containing protein [Planctomycetota bacterium]
MNRSSTWVVSDVGRTPVAKVAARTLRKRLEAVWRELTAACRPRHDPERVHQLRVATRRTLAALMAFRGVIPGKQRVWFEKRLRRIRRAAGGTRDLDVLTGRLERETPRGAAASRRDSKAALVRERLVTMLAKRRDVSRQPIRVVRDELRAADWPARVERLIDAVTAAGIDETFAGYGRRRFRQMLERFFRLADRRLDEAAEIHRFRIAGKKLRYALEIFAPVFPVAERTACHEALERLQETLGEFTDHASAAERFRRWAREKGVGPDRKALAALRRIEDDRAEEARRAFVKWWKPARRRELRRSFARTVRCKPA